MNLKIFVFVLFCWFWMGRVFCEDNIDKNSAEANKERVIESIRRIMTEDNLSTTGADKKKLDDEKPYMELIDGQDGRATIVYRFRNLRSRTAVDAIEAVVGISGTVEEVSDQNLIVVNDVKDKIEELKLVLEKMDMRSPQILVEAKIIEIYLDEGMERDMRFEYHKRDAIDGLNQSAGFSLDAPGQNTLSSQGGGFDLYPYSSGWRGGVMKDINIFLRWLKNARDAKVLSAPNLIVDLGATASMITGEDVPLIQTQVNGGTVTTSTIFKRIGVKLNVTPVIINKGNVKLKINPEVSSILRFEPFTQNNVTVNNPVVAIRNIETELVAADNDVILIGGLYSSEKIKSYRKVPFVGDIPVLGELFTSAYESNVTKQLVFLLKIRILDKVNIGIAHDVEKTAEEVNAVGELIRGSERVFPVRVKSEEGLK